MPSMKQAKAVTLQIKVVPAASRAEIAGWLGHRLKLRVRQPPGQGRANDAVITLLAQQLGLPREALKIARGTATPIKTVAVEGTSEAALRNRLRSLADTPPG